MLRGKSVRSWCDKLSDRSLMVDPLSFFFFQTVLHNGSIKGCVMCLWNDAYKRTLPANGPLPYVLNGGPIELFLIPASAPRLVYQRTWYVL